MKTTIVPLVISLLLVIAVGVLLYRLYRKYDQEIEVTRLKYSSGRDGEFVEENMS